MNIKELDLSKLVLLNNLMLILHTNYINDIKELILSNIILLNYL